MAPVVLIVDDSRAMRRIEKEVVSQLGDIEVIEAEDGVSAIYQLRNNDFRVDLILLDWMMPRMDGLTLVKYLKSHVNLRKIPILMVTSLTDEGKSREAWRHGIDGYLLKPFTKEMLLRAILSLKSDSVHSIESTAKQNGDDNSDGKTFLEQLPGETYKQVLEMAETVDVAADTPVLFKGKVVNHFFFVVDGMLEEHQASMGSSEPIIRTYRKGECFAVTELMSGDALGSNFVTVIKSRLARLQKPDFETLLLNYPEVYIVLSRLLAQKLRQINSDADGNGNGNGDNSLHGSLDILDLADLIQAINLRQKTGTIVLPEIDSKIEINAGQIVTVYSPNCPTDKGEEAFYQIVENKPRNFKFLTSPLSGERNVQMNTTELLFECMRRLDEKGIVM